MINEFLKNKVVPVAVLNDEKETEETLSCLKEGGIYAIEITYRTAYASQAIEYATKNYPEILTGAGTVTTVEQCESAIKAGAKFIVGPGFSEKVAICCKNAGVLYVPGVVTPTEIMMAKDMGLTLLKFFPFSNFGGAGTVKALAGPFPEIKFMLTGGISGDNFTEFLALKNVFAIGGSWMIKGTKEEKRAKIAKVKEGLENLQ